MQEKLAILLSRKLSGEATAGELKELERWIKDHPEDHYFIDSFQAYWYSHAAPEFSDISDSAHFQRILDKAETTELLHAVPSVPSVKRTSRLKWLAVAAAFTGLVLIAAIVMKQQAAAPAADAGGKNMVVTALGARSQILLPDGSKVWLNAATRLNYDKKFNGALREVYLDGEAYFDVRKDKKRPFIVHTSDIDIRVLGTSFNVKSYKEEPTIEATLIHGSIQVSSKLRSGIPQIILKPNEKLVFTKITEKRSNEAVATENHKGGQKSPVYFISKIMAAENDSSVAETSWVHNRLLFDGDTFRELAVKMERWFDVKINFENEEVANYRLRGVFEDETIDEALKALQQIARFKYTMNEKIITISK